MALALTEQVQQRTVEHVPAPVLQLIGQQRTVDVPIPQVLEETAEMDTLDPHQRGQQWTVEHVPGPQILKETVEAVTVVPVG